jgi:hypothetical protein
VLLSLFSLYHVINFIFHPLVMGIYRRHCNVKTFFCSLLTALGSHRLFGMPLDFASQPPMSIYNAVYLLKLCGPGTEILDAGLCPLQKSDFYQLSAPSLSSLPTLI